MTTTTHYWKTQADDLRRRSVDVLEQPIAAELMTARMAAKVLSGIVGLISRRWSKDLMQRTAADLVRHDGAWSTSLRDLPCAHGEEVAEPMMLMAVVARSLLPMAGVKNVRAALSFWATEDDPGTWQSVVEG